MDSKQFLEALKLCVRDAAVSGTIETLTDPPGRRVSDADRRSSEWFNALSSEDKGHVERAIASAVDGAIFGMLAVIDGVRTVENTSEKGDFVLIHKKEDTEIVLNPPDGDYLHNIYNSVD
jgi:hypothetical protein